MPDLIELEVATPEKLMVRENVADVQIPGKDGYLGILPGHAALLGLLGTGVLSYAVGGQRHSLSVQGGFIEVLPEHVRVLANLAERAEDINVERAKAELKKAQDQVADPNSGVEPSVALDALALAQARIDAAK
jgi:F-type H+-transporting ATPase subunit epsilon